MQLTLITLSSEAGTTFDGGAARLVDTLWAAARAEDRVEHISVRAVRGRVDIGVFSVSMDQTVARTVARELVERALVMSPQLRQWSVAGTVPGLAGT
ncbi:hypothetical protein [Plantactinospora endophytica]|uniref:FMN-dependent dehydrogenase domain-containing protein n=1 Tax=Plantactinospora endophytica TaxID=673535 RepID=A0ABQ4DZL7_9ACTN|nr:hypothetical protein [Plantactinospora endophytica]GIG87905.1 hypothetical protein Pen02_28410 [Plantactinospora endophytica]